MASFLSRWSSSLSRSSSSCASIRFWWMLLVFLISKCWVNSSNSGIKTQQEPIHIQRSNPVNGYVVLLSITFTFKWIEPLTGQFLHVAQSCQSFTVFSVTVGEGAALYYKNVLYCKGIEQICGLNDIWREPLSGMLFTSCTTNSLINRIESLQGDTSRWFKPPFDIKTKVLF